MEVLGITEQVYLRLINFIFVIYGVNRTIKQDYKDRIKGYFTNLTSAFLTAMVSVVLSLVSFIIYAEIRGGEAYIDGYIESFIFGGDPSLYQFVMGLFLEGSAASLIVAFAMMQYWKNKVDAVNVVDDINHNHPE
ncbi:hypothetical protein GCM10007424_18960 [Flavobacterium suaedae]|uniref:MotA/TolQ/ExbB proton channel domain-containing protein n=2 Tax=Flavobacterium suaedae TaxID=1767027 RepID=A0ABQ1JZN2_9FLAO|nr:hypothetical protein GCM10007424_18960 [Flavobacterium suaedae]